MDKKNDGRVMRIVPKNLGTGDFRKHVRQDNVKTRRVL